jgi:hypothetical protein
MSTEVTQVSTKIGEGEKTKNRNNIPVNKKKGSNRQTSVPLNNKNNSKNSKNTPLEVGTRLFNLSKIKKQEKSPLKDEIKKPFKEESARTKYKVETMINRFKAHQELTNRKIEDLKRRLEEEELKTLRNKPEINRSRSAKYNEGFLQRQENYRNSSQQKRNQLAEEENKRRTEECGLNLQSKNRKISKGELESKINVMLNWEVDRQEKLRLKQNESYFQQIEDCTFTPRINDHSKIIAQAQNELFGTLDVSERLYQQNNYTTLKKNREIIDVNNYVNLVTKTGENTSISNNNKTRNETNISNISNIKNQPIGENLSKSYDSIEKRLSYSTHNNNQPILTVSGKLFDKLSKKEEKIIEALIRRRIENQ